MSRESFDKPFEQRNELESEMEELGALLDRRELLQEHWSELFEKTQDIVLKYPSDVQFDEQHRYKSDRSFLSSEDKEEFLVLEEGDKERRGGKR